MGQLVCHRYDEASVNGAATVIHHCEANGEVRLYKLNPVDPTA
jgi:hypothetical protein